MHAYIHMCVYVYTYVHIYTCACMHMYMYMYIYTYMDIRTYLYIHTRMLCLQVCLCRPRAVYDTTATSGERVRDNEKLSKLTTIIIIVITTTIRIDTKFTQLQVRDDLAQALRANRHVIIALCTGASVPSPKLNPRSKPKTLNPELPRHHRTLR